jgi:hypothetical protein
MNIHFFADFDSLLQCGLECLDGLIEFSVGVIDLCLC